MQYNMEAAQLKRTQEAQAHAEDLAQARANLHSEQGFWNLGATSQKVRRLFTSILCVSAARSPNHSDSLFGGPIARLHRVQLSSLC